MDFKDQLKVLGDRAMKLKDQIQTEEATKNALIMPFLTCLGYDVFNPLEVTPELVCDIGLKKGEKIDYAILKDGQPVILIECKHWAQSLDIHDGQLLRYFHVSKAKFSLLTNGLIFRFYTDLVKPNIMDEKPFLEMNITDLRDNIVDEVKKFHKSYFDVGSIVNTAEELKYTNELKAKIHQVINSPTPEFVRFFARDIYPNMITQKVLDQFTNLLKKSFSVYLSDHVTDRLKSALTKEEKKVEEQTDVIDIPVSDSPSITTTEEEIEAFHIVRSILRKKIAVNRIVHRDVQSYFGILLDDNNRKPICRLYLNGVKKFIGIFDTSKKETRHEISCMDDIYKFDKSLLDTVDSYVKNPVASE